MRFAISGSSGFVGTALIRFLQSQGHEVIQLQRQPEKAGVFFDAARGQIDLERLENLDCLINLSGANIADKRWSETRKKEIFESRIITTRFLSHAISQMTSPPKSFLSTSACGYYGPNAWEDCTESSPPGKGFLSEVCIAWEKAATEVPLPNTRVVLPRLGVIFGDGGGMLGKILPVFRLGLGGKLGNGKQWMSWMSREDVCRALLFCAETPSLAGPVNFVSPTPCTNEEFTKALGGALSRPTLATVPRFAIELAFGEMGRETALASSKVLPRKLLQAGYQFLDTDLKLTLQKSTRS